MANLFPVFERPLTEEEHLELARFRGPIRMEDLERHRAIRRRERTQLYEPHGVAEPVEHVFKLDDFGLGHFVRPLGLPLAGRTEKGSQINAILEANADVRRLFSNGLREILVAFEWR